MKLHAAVLALLVHSVTALPAQETPSLADRYRPAANRLIEAALADQRGWKKLTHLTTRTG